MKDPTQLSNKVSSILLSILSASAAQSGTVNIEQLANIPIISVDFETESMSITPYSSSYPLPVDPHDYDTGWSTIITQWSTGIYPQTEPDQNDVAPFARFSANSWGSWLNRPSQLDIKIAKEDANPDWAASTGFYWQQISSTDAPVISSRLTTSPTDDNNNVFEIVLDSVKNKNAASKWRTELNLVSSSFPDGNKPVDANNFLYVQMNTEKFYSFDIYIDHETTPLYFFEHSNGGWRESKAHIFQIWQHHATQGGKSKSPPFAITLTSASTDIYSAEGFLPATSDQINWKIDTNQRDLNTDRSIITEYTDEVNFPPLEKAKWHNFIIHAKPALDNEGFFTVWLNGEKIISKQEVTFGYEPYDFEADHFDDNKNKTCRHNLTEEVGGEDVIIRGCVSNAFDVRVGLYRFRVGLEDFELTKMKIFLDNLEYRQNSSKLLLKMLPVIISSGVNQ